MLSRSGRCFRGQSRKEVNKRRRHFNMSKTGFVSQMGSDATQTNPRDVLVDESKQADIENLGIACVLWVTAIAWRFLAHDCAL